MVSHSIELSEEQQNENSVFTKANGTLLGHELNREEEG